MKKYTQNEFDNFEKDDNGIVLCPSGDYSAISSFGKWCSFSEGCSFGKWCSFSEGCSFGKRCSFSEGCSFGKGCSFGEWCSIESGKKMKTDYILLFNGLGSQNRCTQAFWVSDGIYIRCGCFAGYIDAFRKEINKTHGDTKIAKEYLMMCDLIELRYSK